jgi:hypothetical protein
LFINIRIAASVDQDLQLISGPVGAWMCRLLSRLFMHNPYPLVPSDGVGRS